MHTIYIRLYQQIGLLGAGIVALFQLVGLNKLFGLLPLAYGSRVPQLTCIWMSRSKWVGEPDWFTVKVINL